MTRRAWTWVGFATCVALLAGAVGAVSVAALRADAGDRAARAHAERAAEVRLALWRMDSAVQPLLAREGARPPEHYLATDGSSPLTGRESRLVLLHFDFGPDGATLTSPEVVPLHLFTQYDLSRKVTARAEERLERLRDRVPVGALSDSLQTARIAAVHGLPEGAAADTPESEYGARVLNIATANAEAAMLASASSVAGPMTPLWHAGDLFLVRRAQVGDQEHIQGVWLDWPALRSELRAAAGARLPDSDLVRAGDDAPFDRRLAALPLVLYAGPDPDPAPRGTTLVLLLGLAWAGVLAASGAGGALLAGSLRLSDRRAAFVAAVTHELRTPLTTITTYSEMLADARMTDEAQRRRYLETLQREAGRLGALVDNVLAYSRIERGRPGLATDDLDAAAVLDRCAPRLRDRAAAANMELVVEPPPADDPVSMVADEVAVDQILFNLVDNACKHAAAASDRRIVVSAAAAGDAIRFTVRDHGPGIPAGERRQLFAPFRRAKSTSGPGVGLGLALCRRLARHMRGDLALDPEATPGAAFIFTVPRGTGA